MQDMWEVTLALPAPSDSEEFTRSSAPGNMTRTLSARSSSPHDISMSQTTRNWAEANQSLRGELANVQHVQSEWQTHLGGEVNEVLRHQGNAAQNATRVPRHESGG